MPTYPLDPHPPDTYLPDPQSSRCGASWNREVTVTAELPGVEDSGASETLPPLATEIPLMGFDSPEERSFYSELSELRDEMVDRLPLIPEYARPAIDHLLETADTQWEWIWDYYRQWEDGSRMDGESWPLPLGDDPTTFSASCTTDWANNDAVCPTPETIAQRQTDRERMNQRAHRLLAHLRCAQINMFRITLRAQPPTEPDPTGMEEIVFQGTTTDAGAEALPEGLEGITYTGNRALVPGPDALPGPEGSPQGSGPDADSDKPTDEPTDEPPDDADEGGETRKSEPKKGLPSYVWPAGALGLGVLFAVFNKKK